MTFFQVLPSILSILSTVVLALVGWGFRSTISELRGAIKHNTDEIEKVDKRHVDEIKKVDKRHLEKTEKLEARFDELKSDLPFVYVLREDFVRSLNNVDKQMGDINKKLDRLIDKK